MVFTGLLCSCNSQINHPETISYDDYQKIFKDITSKIQIPEISLKDSTLGGNITAIDKDLSFDKREYLTKTGTMKSQPTNEIAIYEDAQQERQIYIRVIYTENSIGKDMLDWSDATGFKNIKDSSIKNSDIAVLAYENIIIVVHQTAEKEYSSNLTKNVLRSIIKILKKY